MRIDSPGRVRKVFHAVLSFPRRPCVVEDQYKEAVEDQYKEARNQLKTMAKRGYIKRLSRNIYEKLKV
ncbi:MAG: hypothetical protein Q6373_022795 [Candidatus Sigynarchaeota archaeon]